MKGTIDLLMLLSPFICMEIIYRRRIGLTFSHKIYLKQARKEDVVQMRVEEDWSEGQRQLNDFRTPHTPDRKVS